MRACVAISLEVHGLFSLACSFVRVVMTSPADIFDELQKTYRLSAELRTWLTDQNGLNALTLNDFAYSMATESDAKTLVEAAKVPVDQQIQQTSRVRQAWACVRKTIADAEKVKARGRDDVDLDAMLPQQDLDDLHDKFYARYRLQFPAHVMPSEAVVSRLSKEVDKRLLTLRDVWKVRTQAQLLRAVRKTTVIGDGVAFQHQIPQEEPDREPQSLHVYLNKLFALLLGYAIVGAKVRAGAPSPELRSSDSTLCVEIPLDVLYKYYYRVKRFAESLPYSEALVQTLRRDEQEREMWIDAFRQSSDPLGVAIKTVFLQQIAVWQPPERVVRAPALRETPTKRKAFADAEESPQKHKKGKGKGTDGARDKIHSGLFQLTMGRDAKISICSAFQYGKCTEAKAGGTCSKGRHICARKLKAEGRVCGGMHMGKDCLNAKRAL